LEASQRCEMQLEDRDSFPQPTSEAPRICRVACAAARGPCPCNSCPALACAPQLFLKSGRSCPSTTCPLLHIAIVLCLPGFLSVPGTRPLRAARPLLLSMASPQRCVNCLPGTSKRQACRRAFRDGAGQQRRVVAHCPKSMFRVSSTSVPDPVSPSRSIKFWGKRKGGKAR